MSTVPTITFSVTVPQKDLIGAYRHFDLEQLTIEIHLHRRDANRATKPAARLIHLMEAEAMSAARAIRETVEHVGGAD